MRCVLPEQRRSSRVHLSIQCKALFLDSPTQPQNAFLRDINMLGAFFYCRHKPKLASKARLEFELIERDEPIRAIWEGPVVRVEEFAPGAAIGVAIQFSRYEIIRLKADDAKAEVADGAAFIGWTVNMVDRTLITWSR